MKWFAIGVIILYALQCLVSLCYRDWRTATISGMFSITNYLIFFK